MTDIEQKEKGTGEQAATRKRCPFISDPFKDCYCADMQSVNAVRAIYYCGGNFEECAIYKQRIASA